MILSELVSDAVKSGSNVAGTLRILLATRTVRGEQLPADEVQLRDIGELQIDDSAAEIDVMPICFMDSAPQALTVADIMASLEDHPEIGAYSLTGVDRFKLLADGGSAQMTEQIIGTYLPTSDNEIWLLQYPQEQWPKSWFGA